MTMDAQTGRRRFGRFELDLQSCVMSKDGIRIRLQPQPSRVLAILVARAGEVVSRDELRRAIWDTATFVEFDQGLNYCIRQIRQALGDNASEPVFVETVKKVGYHFIAPVERVEPMAAAEPASRPATHAERSFFTTIAMYAVLAIALVAAMLGVRLFVARPTPRLTYTQLTSFTDPAFAPAISADGRMLAFIVGSDASFPSAGEIYTKLLPDGEPVRRTHDSWPKYGVAFSPNGSQITYTVADATHGWSTSALDVLGGDSRTLVANAAGLTWLDNRHALFSEIKSGLHMGLVTATTSRLDVRDIYVPRHERGMSHYAYASPDRSSVLVVEMGPTGAWERCRLVPFDGRSAGSTVGPDGPCTSAAWSPDGSWMYFTARVQGASHVWRQRFPHGQLEQLTFGPGEEDGVALGSDGRSIVTSVGMRESGAWIHDAAGDRLISPDGYAGGLSFSADGRHLYYVLRRASTGTAGELWVSDVATGNSEPLIKGFDVLDYNVSADGSQVVFVARQPGGPPQIWLAPCDSRSAPRLLPTSGQADAPAFGPHNDIVFRESDGATNYLIDMKLDGSGHSKLLPGAIVEFKGMSPDRQWAVAMVPVDEVPSTAVVAVSLRDGSVKRICPAQCLAQWSPDGSRFYVAPLLQGLHSGMTVVVPLERGTSLPDLPPTGVSSAADSSALRGGSVIDLSTYDPAHQGLTVAPGLSQGTFAYTKTISHRNLFRITLP